MVVEFQVSHATSLFWIKPPQSLAERVRDESVENAALSSKAS